MRTNIMVAITVICATTATAVAQSPPAQETSPAAGIPTITQRSDAGFEIIFPSKGGVATRTSITCKTTSDGWGKTCYYSTHNCSDLSDDRDKCCGGWDPHTHSDNVIEAYCNAKTD
jgi:hypothetical protein